MNESNVRTRSQTAFAICEIFHPPVEGDIQRVFPLDLHAERNSSAFRGLKDCLFNSRLWISLLRHWWGGDSGDLLEWQGQRKIA